jgi:hypothetical protein
MNIKQKLEIVFLSYMSGVSYIFYVWFMINNAIFLGVMMMGILILSTFELCNEVRDCNKRPKTGGEKLK